MNDREWVSALMDGELDAAQRAQALDKLQSDPALADTWRRWQLVRASLQHEAGDAVDMSAGIAARVAQEPALLQPRGRVLPLRQRPLWAAMAVAACLVMAVALWVERAQEPADAGFTALYAAAPHETVISEPAVATTVPLDDVQRANAYIVMHSEYAHRGMQAGLRNFTRLAMADEGVAGEGL